MFGIFFVFVFSFFYTILFMMNFSYVNLLRAYEMDSVTCLSFEQHTHLKNKIEKELYTHRFNFCYFFIVDGHNSTHSTVCSISMEFRLVCLSKSGFVVFRERVRVYTFLELFIK